MRYSVCELAHKFGTVPVDIPGYGAEKQFYVQAPSQWRPTVLSESPDGAYANAPSVGGYPVLCIPGSALARISLHAGIEAKFGLLSDIL
ncbi:MAG: hypothetical protein ACYS74_21990 [Planctomycetota bacterium]